MLLIAHFFKRLHQLQSIEPWGIYSVWRRHATVYQKTWLVNFLPPITEPLVYLMAFGYGLTPLIDQFSYLGQEISYPAFISPAMIAVAILFQAFFESAYGSFIRFHYQHTWHALLTAPLSYTQIFAGDWLWASTRGLISGVITGLVTVLLGFYPWTGLLGSLPILILGSLLFAAIGLYAAGRVETVDQLNVPIFMFVIPMFVLCGTYFPRENLPDWLAQASLILPLAPMVDLVRWPFGLPPLWPLEVLWLLILTIGFTYLAWRRIFYRLLG